MGPDGQSDLSGQAPLRRHGGDYVAKNTLIETDAERTYGYDFDNADGDNDVWTGWDADVAFDFTGDGDTNDVKDASWWGHCTERTAAVICENEPTGNYNAPNDVVFTAPLKKGLLVALYHGCIESDGHGPDIEPHVWHARLELWFFLLDEMFVCDIYNSAVGPDIIWYHPIYAIEKAEYEQKPGQDDEKVVRIKCECKYWYSGANSLYYWYDVTYADNGAATEGEENEWKEHPSAPADFKKPDSICRAVMQESLDSHWKGELSYDTIRSIVPEP